MTEQTSSRQLQAAVADQMELCQLQKQKQDNILRRLEKHVRNGNYNKLKGGKIGLFVLQCWGQ